jgi:hypothetical protein
MAYREIVRVKGNPQPWLNLSFSVGRPGVNRNDDVMLVQALFNFVAAHHGGDMSLLGTAQLPDVTGDMDHLTTVAIQRFHLRWMRFMPALASTLHPAAYQAVDLSLNKRIEPITMLVTLAKDIDPADFTRTIRLEFPQIRSFITRNS